ncbi:hypothetical protein QKY98_11190 [Pseudomonas sp. HR1]|uniref:tetratricopeptide repeat protein n=1 Tax=Pseudomonas sp. HR1 TaxID=1463361 RepID=UPI002543F6E2|nr:hypothetical protein [Pseudomonas sp. HR1]MDK4199687.1 hypothetical protein [Pseudomonas sp. HR1]
MSGGNRELDRKVLPIWDSSTDAVSLAENKSVKKQVDGPAPGSLSRLLLEELEATDTAGVAAELFNVSSIEGEQKGKLIAAQKIISTDNMPGSLVLMAKQALEGESYKNEFQTDLINTQQQISLIRSALTIRPRDPLAWADLARLHIAEGHHDHAEKAMLVAIGLAPRHRWLSRVAARLFLHLDQPDRSSDILTRNPSLKADPWLIATEISLAQVQSKTSKYINSGKDLLKRDIGPAHLSELASSMATQELSSGAIKRARPYFKQSLIVPNRSSLAQAKWAEQAHDIKTDASVDVDLLTYAYEAKTWASYIKMDINDALSYSMDWQRSEPYSSKPAVLASYFAAILDDYPRILDMTDKGLKVSPGNETLHLNQIYAKVASIGVHDAAIEEADIVGWIKYIKSFSIAKGESRSHAIANMGLLCYRLGESDLGKRYYEKAEKISRDEKHENHLLLMVNHWRESLLANSPWESALLKNIQSAMKNSSGIGLPAALFYLDKIQKFKASGVEWKAYIANDSGSLDRKPLFVHKSDDLKSAIHFYLD